MKTKFVLLTISSAVALGIIWPIVKGEAQDKRVLVWVCPGNSDARGVAQGIEAKFNSTLRFETVKDTYNTDIVVFVNCMSVENNTNTLRNQWVCSSIAQVVVGDIVAIPYDEADNLVVGTPEYAATAIFEKTVSRSSDGELQKVRDRFRKKVSLYCKMLNCAEQEK